MRKIILEIGEGDGALFDLDGVLIDSESSYTEFWAQTGRSFKLPSPTFAHDIKGTTLTDILTTYFPDPDTKERVKTLIHEYEQTMQYPFFAGAKEIVTALRESGVKVAVVTSSDATKMGYLFRQHPDFKDMFDAIIDGSMVKKSKPDPEGYLKAAEAIDAPINRCIVFEDSLQGIEAGRRAKAKVVAIASTNPRNVLEGRADAVVDSIADLQLSQT